MTMDDAQTISDLLLTLDDAREWIASFKVGDEPKLFIGFSDVTSADNVRLDGERSGWEGDLRMTRETAIRMMEWLEHDTVEKLRALGVDTKPQGSKGETGS